MPQGPGYSGDGSDGGCGAVDVGGGTGDWSVSCRRLPGLRLVRKPCCRGIRTRTSTLGKTGQQLGVWGRLSRGALREREEDAAVAWALVVLSDLEGVLKLNNHKVTRYYY